ncbi:MAG: hypothetical protein BWY67_00854 [Bacteroidetes bacterium ADurb.Bin397]|nr:MAG: hypothetical protein BWY67_00854 [Bacteroidetes bacterium ADurb.Bin397]
MVFASLPERSRSLSAAFPVGAKSKKEVPTPWAFSMPLMMDFTTVVLPVPAPPEITDKPLSNMDAQTEA